MITKSKFRKIHSEALNFVRVIISHIFQMHDKAFNETGEWKKNNKTLFWIQNDWYKKEYLSKIWPHIWNVILIFPMNYKSFLNWHPQTKIKCQIY